MKKQIIAMMVVAGASGTLHAQSFRHTLFDAVPVNLNPAHTGMMDGSLRGNLNHRMSWGGTPLYALMVSAFSLDAPVYTRNNGDYIGVGLMGESGSSGLDNDNFAGTISAAYHKRFGTDDDWQKGRGSQLSLGVQGGYKQTSIDLSTVYFSGPATTGYSLGKGNTVNYYQLNAGVAFSQSLSERFKYVAGVTVQNINQPNDALLKKQTDAVGLEMLYAVSLGADATLSKRFSLRPGLVFYSQAGNNNLIAGNEFVYLLDKGSKSNTSLMCGIWYRTERFAMLSAGIIRGDLRVRASYDYKLVSGASNGEAGFEFAMGYVMPAKKPTKRHVPCTRF